MKKRCEKSSFPAKIEKWEQRYGGKQLRRMNKEAQNVKHLKIAVDFLEWNAHESRAHTAERHATKKGKKEKGEVALAP